MANELGLYRKQDNAVLGGVCSGIADANNWDVVMVRVVYVIISLVVVGAPVLLYLLLWLIIPEKNTRIRQQQAKQEDPYDINADFYE